MDASKTAHQSVKEWLQKHPVYKERKMFTPSSLDYLEEQLKWYCQDCTLMLTSEAQAQEHFLGKKHQNVIKNKLVSNICNDQKKLSKQCSGTHKSLLTSANPQLSSYCRKFHFTNFWTAECEMDNFSEVIPPPASRDNILETVIKGDKKPFSSSDLSIYRTPSGKYYCQSCNLTANSQAQFLQHTESRKHKQKANKTFKLK